MLIKFRELQEKHAVFPRNILHVGAPLGEEGGVYIESGASNLVWIEANHRLAETLRSVIGDDARRFEREEVFCAAVTNRDGEAVELHLTNNLASSSLKPFKYHAEKYPDIEVIERMFVETRRIGALLKDWPEDFDFANIDIQGPRTRGAARYGS